METDYSLKFVAIREIRVSNLPAQPFAHVALPPNPVALGIVTYFARTRLFHCVCISSPNEKAKRS